MKDNVWSIPDTLKNRENPQKYYVYGGGRNCGKTHWLEKYFEEREKQMRKEEKASIVAEIKELAEFHSVCVPIVYGDGTKSTDKMLSLAELGYILAEIFDDDEVDDKLLEDMKKVSVALSDITNKECCDYGYEEACEIADRYAERGEEK